MDDPRLRNYVLGTISPVVRYGLYEMKYTSVAHSMFEVAAIAYLMGRGYDFPAARQIVESWEVNESFPPYQYRSGKRFLLRQPEKWQPVVTELNLSLYGEQMVCSASTQLFHIPETKDLKGNADMHTHLVPASYHRVTAVGSALRLQGGESAASIEETLISCIQNAETRDRGVRAGLLVMRDAASDAYKPFVENIILWQNYAESHLQNAKRSALRMGLFRSQN